MRIGLGAVALGVGALMLMGGGLGGGKGIADSVTGNTPGGLSSERLALDAGGAYALGKGGSKCISSGLKMCFKGGGGGGGGGGGDAAKRTQEDEPATTTTQPAPAPPPQPAPPAPPAPEPEKEPAPAPAPLTDFGANRYFGDGGNRLGVDPGLRTDPQAHGDLLLPMPQGQLR